MESSRAFDGPCGGKKIPGFGMGIVTATPRGKAWGAGAPDELNKCGDAARAALAMLSDQTPLTRADHGRENKDKTSKKGPDRKAPRRARRGLPLQPL